MLNLFEVQLNHGIFICFATVVYPSALGFAQFQEGLDCLGFLLLLRTLGAYMFWKIQAPSGLITDMGQLFVAPYPYEAGVWVGKSHRGSRGWLGKWEEALWFFLFVKRCEELHWWSVTSQASSHWALPSEPGSPPICSTCLHTSPEGSAWVQDSAYKVWRGKMERQQMHNEREDIAH